MHRRSSCRLRGAIGVAGALAVATLGSFAPTASADSLLAAKQQQYRHVRAQVHRLDMRAELLTERYDRAVWQLHVLKGKIAVATTTLQREQAELAYQKGILSQLLITQYKSGDPKVIEIVLGSTSLSQVTNSIALKARFDTAVSDTVSAIRAARDAIAHERQTLLFEQGRVKHTKRVLAQARRTIRAELKRRRALVAELGAQVTVLEAAGRIGQATLALKARTWIQLDQRLNRADPGQALRDQVALDSLEQIGVPYVWGGASTDGFDCSGLVMWLWAQHVVTLPHFAAAQYQLGPVVETGPVLDESQLRIGDLLFFHDLGHVGIYIGDGYMVHAPHTGDVVRIAPLSESWFQTTFVGATQPGPA